MFKKKPENIQSSSARMPDFDYLRNDEIYIDNACQSPRPRPVIEAMDRYYQTYNACGGRVKYKWGQKVDAEVEETRDLVIDYLGLSKKDYVCAFTLNTTYGLNLILSQLPARRYEKIVTSEIEHNSVFLPTMTHAKRLGIKRVVLQRADYGNLIYEKSDLVNSVVVVNTTSNIDGRLLGNLKELVDDTHKSGGVVILDAAQTTAHHSKLLNNCGADAICFSAHKMYAASLGVMVIKKEFLKSLDINFIGGGMVTSVSKDSYLMWPDDMSSWLEPGLQAYAEIISLNTAIKWLKSVNSGEYMGELSNMLFNGLSNISDVVMINKQSSPVISFYVKNIDSHRLATFLSTSNIMVRSGYFCCHYYLIEKLHLPPLLRFSIGLQNNEKDIETTIEIMKKFTKG